MASKVTKWYEVRYFENGAWHQEIGRGKREAKALHKAHPGSIYLEYSR